MRNLLARFAVLVPLLSCLALSGCKVFDESLLEESEPTDGMDPVEEPDPALAVTDPLVCDAPLVESVNAYRRVDLTELGDDLPALPNCLGGAPAPGNDAFFAVDMVVGQKWHFHVQVSSPAIDPAIYVLDSCSDSRSCQNTHFGINACGPGQNEHFSFLAPATGTYYVGVDSLIAGGEAVNVFAVNAECGNLTKEHSEYCDDGNDDVLDGCHRCRPVILADGSETEPNDGPLDPNLIHFPDGFGHRRVTGTLSGCDFDFFEIEVPAGARTSVAFGEGVDCGRAELELRRPGDPKPFAVSDADPGAECPVVDGEALEPGTYLVRVASRREVGLDLPSLDYTLDIAIEAEPEE